MERYPSQDDASKQSPDHPFQSQPLLSGGYISHSPTDGSSSTNMTPYDRPYAERSNGSKSDSLPRINQPTTDGQREDKSLDQTVAPRRQSQGGTKRTCGKCGQSLTGQFVRALDNTYHLECFTCHECGKIVASKFFPVPDQPPNQYPLCETDYFRRLDLLCFACGAALRGSYITALERKYHIEHFTCSVCPTVFGAQDSYYEHNGSVYCHYHYSTKFAQKCNGCHTAILKQFVEIFRNGQNQHWHPECYMIHKYWNVRLFTSGEKELEQQKIDDSAGDAERQRVRAEEELVESKVLWIWRTLSGFEEKSATCISDMLLHVSNGAYIDGVMSAKRFIIHVDILFTAADNLDSLMMSQTAKGLSYAREAKLLCKKVVAFFQLLTESQNTGVRRLGVTQELLSLVTGLAHYLKLLIRICLQGALKFERETYSEQGLRGFLDEISILDERLAAEDSSEVGTETSDYVSLSADTCPVCNKPVEDRCFKQGQTVFHPACMSCDRCHRDMSIDPAGAIWDMKDEQLLCASCSGGQASADGTFSAVSRLQFYVHLLKVAHARLLATLRTSGALPHTSDDPNLAQYDSQTGHRVPSTTNQLEPPLLRSNTRSKSYGGKSSSDERAESSYEQSLGDIRRLRSTRESKELSSTTKRARTSRIVGSPERDAVQPGLQGAGDSKKHAFTIITERDLYGEPAGQLSFGNTDSIRLDDIPRIVAASQAREQRPNANRYARGGLLQTEPKPRIMSSHRREGSGHDSDKLGPEGHRPKKYFSELSALEYFIVRHAAVLSMEPLLGGQFNQEELLDLIETRKPTFWGKFGKAFKQDKAKGGKRRGVFGVSLDVIVEKDGAESTDGVGPGALRIPALIQDAISAMRTMDMSMEGVFRKNGNIRRLKEMADTVNEKGGDALDLNLESPVQVAALLKKFLRELPDPVLTSKLHRLWIASQKIPDEETRRRVLHLTCCLLPKSHRDTMEVLFCFMSWVASFSVVDEESGSKMDVHNLATVIAPNILYSTSKAEEMEDSFLAIEAVHCLIECNESMCQVPEDLQSILNDSLLFSSSAEITTKSILQRYAEIGRPVPSANSPASNSATNSTGTGTPNTNGKNNNNNNNSANNNSTSSRDSRGTSPVVTRVDVETPTRSATTWQAETPLRPARPSTPPTYAPPAPANGYAAHTGMYGGPSTAPSSRDSLGVHGGGAAGLAPAGSPSGRYYSRPSADSRSQSQLDLAGGRPEGGVGVT